MKIERRWWSEGYIEFDREPFWIGMAYTRDSFIKAWKLWKYEEKSNFYISIERNSVYKRVY